MPISTPSDQRFDFGLPGSMEGGVINLMNSLLPAADLTAEQIAATQALVSGAGKIIADGVALYDVTTTNSTTCTIGSASASFSAADIGKVCALVPYTDTQLIAGTAGAWGTITAVASANQCTAVVSLAPGVLANAIFVYGTDNKTILDDLLTTAAAVPTKGHVYLPAGIICSAGSHTVPSGVLLHGAGNNTTGGSAKDFKHYGTSLVCCKYSATGAFIAMGSFGTSDPRGAAMEYLNVDSMCMTPRCIDGSISGRTERLFAVTAVRSSSGSTLQVGPTGRAMLCHVLHNNVSDACGVSGDGKVLDCLVIGALAGRAKIAISNPTDVLVSRNHVWSSAGVTTASYGIRVSFNGGVTNSGCCTISDNEIDTTFSHAYYIAASAASAGRAVSITGGHVFNNDSVPNNSGSVLGISVASGCSIRGIIFKNVVGMSSFNNPTLGQWANLVDNSATAGNIYGFSTGGCVVQGCNAMYSAIIPDVDDVNITMAANGTVLTKSTRI